MTPRAADPSNALIARATRPVSRSALRALLGEGDRFTRTAREGAGEEFFIEERRAGRGGRLLLWARLMSRPAGAGFEIELVYQLQAQGARGSRVYVADARIARAALASGRSAISELLFLDAALLGQLMDDFEEIGEALSGGGSPRPSRPEGALEPGGFFQWEIEQAEWASGREAWVEA